VGITASISLGHSLGELTALHWGGAYDADALIRIASARGRAMAEVPGPAGAMASVGADARKVEELIGREAVVVSGLNAPELPNLSGPIEAVERVVNRAAACGIAVIRLKVSHAFHSPLVAPAAPILKAHLESESFLALRGNVASTVTGAPNGKT
jgi:enediyne polyketide synthase